MNSKKNKNISGYNIIRGKAAGDAVLKDSTAVVFMTGSA